MQELDDIELLRKYVDHDSEEAFATLVARHVNKVYSVALRHTGNPHQAEEITQAVFVILAKKSRLLGRGVVLSGWLYQTAHLTAVTLVRSEIRRARREEEAHMQSTVNESEADTWTHIAPLLDTAMGRLGRKDQGVIVMRFFDGKSMREVGTALGTSEDAAKKRVNRAVEKLRTFFTKRGVVLPAAALTAAISANAVQAAPVGLPVSISTAAALAGTTVAATAAATATAIKTIAMTTLQKAIIGVTLVAAVGTGIYEAHQASSARAEVQSLEQQQVPLAKQIEKLTRERDEGARQLAALRDDNERLNRNTGELLKLRNELAQLKTATIQKQNDPTESAMKSWLARVSQLKKRLEQMPDKGIPELQFLKETDWLDTVRNMNVDTEIESRQALNALRNVAKEKVASLVSEALKRYLKANDGKFPADVAQLRPYCEPPIDDSILERYAVLPATDVTNMGLTTRNPDWLIAEKAPVDVDYDTRFVIGAMARGRSHFDADILIPVVRAFQSANNGQQLGDPSRLLPYTQTPEQQRALQKWIQRFPSLQK